MNIRILLIDDFPLIREGFAAALESDPGLTIVGQADNGEDGLRLARELQPDVVILDLRMPEMGGMTVLERLRSESPQSIDARPAGPRALAQRVAGVQGPRRHRAREGAAAARRRRRRCRRLPDE